MAVCESMMTGLETKRLPKSIEAVVFDVDGTLYRQRGVQLGMLRALGLYVLRHPLRGLEVVKAIRGFRVAQERLRDGEFRAGDERRGVRLEQLEWASKASGLDEGFVEAVVDEWMMRRPLDLVRGHARAGLSEVLEELRRRGVKLGVYSDYPAEEKLEALGIRAYFDVAVSSYDDEVARFKPDPRGFEVVLERLSVEAKRAIYVGDRPEVDGVGAERAGMLPVIISSRDGGPRSGCAFTLISGLERLLELGGLNG